MGYREKGEISEVCQEEVFEKGKHVYLFKKSSLLTLLLTPTVGHFHPKESSSSLWTPAGCPPIQFTSESTLSWLKCKQEGPGPTGDPPTPPSPANTGPHTSAQHAHRWRVRMSSPQRTQGTPNLPVSHQVGNSQRGRGGWEWVPHAGASVSLDLAGLHSPNRGLPNLKAL